MTMMDHLSLLSTGDLAALAFLFAAWAGIGRVIEHPPAGRPSVTMLMAEHRRDWMRTFVERESRIFDATILSNLRTGASYFASTSVLAIGGVLAMVGNPAPLLGVAQGLAATTAPTIVWQIRLLVVALLLGHAFLKFVWAHRVFGYSAVLMGAIPNDPADPRALPLGLQAAELNIRAALNFTRGLRSMYFALGTVAWLLGPAMLALAVLVVLWLLWSREFHSVPRDILLGRTG